MSQPNNYIGKNQSLNLLFLINNLLLKKIKNFPIWARLGLFILVLLFIWLPFATPIYLLLNDKDENLTTILTMAILFIVFLFLVKFWGKYIYDNSSIFNTYGLVGNRRNLTYLGKGLILGFTLTWLLFFLEFIFGWVKFQAPSLPIIKLVLEGFLSAIGIGFAEELFFRGWLLSELERDYQPQISSTIDSAIFAIAHFIKPLSEIIRTLVSFPALILLGFTLVWAKRSHKNLLGICIGLHSGLVWGYYVLNVGRMLTYTEVVPDWITGIDQNPIAGIMGLSFLGILGYIIRQKKGTKK